MADKKNLCAQIDIALHNRVTEEKDRLEMTTSQYIAALLTEYYKMKDENGGINMTGSIPSYMIWNCKRSRMRKRKRDEARLVREIVPKRFVRTTSRKGV